MSADLTQTLQNLLGTTDYVEIVAGPQVRIDLRYASANNFTGRDLYGPFNRAFVHRLAFDGLTRVLAELARCAPEHKLIVYDALRPRSVQRVLWREVVGTPNQKYLADPDKGSLHNFGFAIDLSLLNTKDAELDMGAGFDDFREIAQPAREAHFLARGELTPTHLKNRERLRAVMRAGGFRPLAHEWWHFDFFSRAEAEARFKIVE